jgi:hypothetical protein
MVVSGRSKKLEQRVAVLIAVPPGGSALSLGRLHSNEQRFSYQVKHPSNLLGEGFPKQRKACIPTVFLMPLLC